MAQFSPRLTFFLGDGMKVAVGVYVLARTATKPPSVLLYRDTNEPVRTKTRLYHTQTGSLLLPSDTKRAQVIQFSLFQFYLFSALQQGAPKSKRGKEKLPYGS